MQGAGLPSRHTMTQHTSHPPHTLGKQLVFPLNPSPTHGLSLLRFVPPLPGQGTLSGEQLPPHIPREAPLRPPPQERAPNANHKTLKEDSPDTRKAFSIKDIFYLKNVNEKSYPMTKIKALVKNFMR